MQAAADEKGGVESLLFHHEFRAAAVKRQNKK
jgi:hypothetical protein